VNAPAAASEDPVSSHSPASAPVNGRVARVPSTEDPSPEPAGPVEVVEAPAPPTPPVVVVDGRVDEAVVAATVVEVVVGFVVDVVEVVVGFVVDVVEVVAGFVVDVVEVVVGFVVDVVVAPPTG